MRSGRSGQGGLALAAVGLLLAWPTGGLAQGKFANPQLLAETQEVAAHLGDAQQRLVDLRLKADPEGREAYLKGHVPGAVYLAWRELDDVSANRQGVPL